MPWIGQTEPLRLSTASGKGGTDGGRGMPGGGGCGESGVSVVEPNWVGGVPNGGGAAGTPNEPPADSAEAANGVLTGAGGGAANGLLSASVAGPNGPPGGGAPNGEAGGAPNGAAGAAARGLPAAGNAPIGPAVGFNSAPQTRHEVSVGSTGALHVGHTRAPAPAGAAPIGDAGGAPKGLCPNGALGGGPAIVAPWS